MKTQITILLTTMTISTIIYGIYLEYGKEPILNAIAVLLLISVVFVVLFLIAYKVAKKHIEQQDKVFEDNLAKAVKEKDVVKK